MTAYGSVCPIEAPPNTSRPPKSDALLASEPRDTILAKKTLGFTTIVGTELSYTAFLDQAQMVIEQLAQGLAVMQHSDA